LFRLLWDDCTSWVFLVGSYWPCGSGTMPHALDLSMDLRWCLPGGSRGGGVFIYRFW
jgi:hypothetical protein